MEKLLHSLSKILEIFVIAILATMSCLVFLNVVLRYGFNSSINVTEEVSRYLFVWLTFLGAILAFNENLHVNVSILTHHLSIVKKRLLSIFTDASILFCCYLIIKGSWVQFQLNLHNLSPISEIPTAITYLASIISGAAIGLLVSIRIICTIRTVMKGENL
ncbi:TRAP-type C4-dicarboxylate transport system permease small subunit [Bisgaardia hudsonensis]|uniref:TRAP transporter small permease protein n=1 Tax=Bisgaardia hudsonensis TaxID=109472 RepID=A0A4R2MSQ3_9PAST|nr:TRAP transporter small permease [Bisgaardia hudsonensis]QLB13749.1 C4-dicarboxylate ABC transporter permease [Bisgaardia hudsonensis]TCP11066.1 TRAP-type C4-dicarboxylate transport system permease small subunit [Bisgaardia hudsonensis]